MNGFRLGGTALALVMASALPAFAQNSTILLGVGDTDTLYRVDATLAAELCGISEAQLALIAAQSGTIYCRALPERAEGIDFENDDRFDRFNGDDNDDVAEGEPEPAPVDEATEGETDTDVDAGTDADTDTDPDTGTETDVGTDAGTGTEAGTDADAGTDAEAGTDADPGTDADADVGTDVDAGDAGTDADAGTEG